MRALRILAFLCFTIVVVVAGAGITIGTLVTQHPPLVLWAIDTLWSPPPQPHGEVRQIAIPPGSSALDISLLLKERRLIDDPRSFTAAASWMGVGARLQAGEYQLTSGSTITALLAALQDGRSKLIRVAIPEGRRAEEVAQIVAASGIATAEEFLRLAVGNATSYLQDWRPPGSTLEGYLFPDTYLVPSDYEASDFIKLQLRTFDSRAPQPMRELAKALDLTFHEAITLASIVERETAVADERALIAGVFLNRLREGLPLGADPTVQYALARDPEQRRFGWWKRDLTFDDLEYDSPYNTYRNAGFPPGPICNPGLAAIEAVLHPQESDYLYFVARPDGTHAFAATFGEHLRNIARYQQ